MGANANAFGGSFAFFRNLKKRTRVAPADDFGKAWAARNDAACGNLVPSQAYQVPTAQRDVIEAVRRRWSPEDRCLLKS
jgi:hypothetical protein